MVWSHTYIMALDFTTLKLVTHISWHYGRQLRKGLRWLLWWFTMINSCETILEKLEFFCQISIQVCTILVCPLYLIKYSIYFCLDCRNSHAYFVLIEFKWLPICLIALSWNTSGNSKPNLYYLFVTNTLAYLHNPKIIQKF
jgi:hypothetical protein